MQATIELEKPGRSELNLYLFMKQVEKTFSDLEHAVLEHVVAAGTTRGWFPTLAQLVVRLSEHDPAAKVEAAIARVRASRLLDVSNDGRILCTVSGITHEPTTIRAFADGSGIQFYLRSALDALTIAGTLQKPVVVYAICAQTGAKLQIDFDATGAIIESSPRTVTAFVPGWDGKEPLGTALTRGGFFASDAALGAWQAAHGEPDGTPLTEDTIRMVGGELAGALAALYVAVSVHGHH